MTINVEDIDNARALATAAMLTVLMRACHGKLERGEAEAAESLMAAYEHWTNASQRCELVERAKDIQRLGEAVGRDSAVTLESVDQLRADINAVKNAGRHKSPASASP